MSLQVQFNKRTIMPVSYEGKRGIGFNATIFTPIQYGIRFAEGVQPVEQMKAVMTQCAENSEEVEIQFTEGQNQYGKYFEIYSVKPLNPSPSSRPDIKKD